MTSYITYIRSGSARVRVRCVWPYRTAPDTPFDSHGNVIFGVSRLRYIEHPTTYCLALSPVSAGPLRGFR